MNQQLIDGWEICIQDEQGATNLKDRGAVSYVYDGKMRKIRIINQ